MNSRLKESMSEPVAVWGRRAFQEAGGAGAKALEQELAMSEPGSGGGR